MRALRRVLTNSLNGPIVYGICSILPVVVAANRFPLGFRHKTKDMAMTRKDFLLALPAAAAAGRSAVGEPVRQKLLIVVAHPDDEYDLPVNARVGMGG